MFFVLRNFWTAPNEIWSVNRVITWETFFLKNHTQNVVEKLFPCPFLKNQNWAYLWINIPKFYIFCFNCLPSWGLSKMIKTKLQPICSYLKQSFFVFYKKWSGTSLLASFSTWFLKKNISVVIFYYLTKFQCLVAFTSWDIGQYVYSNCLLTKLWRQKFWNLPYLSD